MSEVFLMRRHIRPAALAALAIFFALLTIVAQVAIDSPMSTARDGAVAVALKDGRILAIAGKDAAGTALDTAEFLGAGSALASKLSSPRTGHFAVTLDDGRVLVAGGRNAQGAIVNTTEIFDPVSESFSLASSSMLEARAGATATLLEDGRVFIAGGEGPSGVLASTEIFDPATGLFTPRAPMSTPRRAHAAAEASEIVLHLDHRVVIAGGNNGSADLASIELYDHVTNAMSTFGAAMANPRAGLTATPLLKGQILLAGGSIAGAPTAATEILDLPSSTLAPGPNMSQPRTGHFSVLLPDNNTVLMAGGATTSPAAEIFVSWQNQFTPFGALAAARTGIAAAATSANHLGVARIGGGSDANGAAGNATEKALFATVWPDKWDYQPGDHVLLSGTGYQPGETVNVVLEENPHVHDNVTRTVTAGPGGSFSNVDIYTVELHDLNIRFFLNATGQGSGQTAGTTFTDARNATSVISPTTAVIGVATPYTLTITNTSSGSPTGNIGAVCVSIPAGITVSATPTVTATDPGGISRSAGWTPTFVSGTSIGAYRSSANADDDINPYDGNDRANVHGNGHYRR
jgi:hypothetical protein